jgi:hypothetical protein
MPSIAICLGLMGCAEHRNRVLCERVIPSTATGSYERFMPSITICLSEGAMPGNNIYILKGYAENSNV